MPFGLQPTHLIIILAIALLIFGPSRLPEMGRSFGKMLREFQSATKEASQGFSEQAQQKPVETKPVEAKQDGASTITCKSCAKPLQAGMKFCPECGSAQ